MNYKKGSAAVWAIVILLIIIVAGAAYWYWSQNSAQPTPLSITRPQAQQNSSASVEPSKTTQTQTATQTGTAASPAPQPTTVQNKNGQLIAAPAGPNAWQFVVSGNFGLQQDAYVINFGDGTKADLNKCPGATNDNPVCRQFSPVTHTYTHSGTYRVMLTDTFTGAGSESTNTLFTLDLSN